MTQEEEQLLFDDLSGRLRYGVICQIDYHDDAVLWGIPNADTFTFCDGVIERYISQVKPYLRPMWSMTDEEVKEYLGMLNDIDKSGLMNHKFITKVVDWLDKKMFDHRGLIPKGLALVAPEDMYKTK